MNTKASSPIPEAAASGGHRTRVYLGLLTAALACLLVMLAYLLWAGRHQAVQAAEVSTRNLVLAMESRVHGDFERASAVLDFIVAEVLPEQMQQSAVATNNATQSARMAGLLEKFPQVAVTNLFDAQGDLLYSSSPATPRFNITDRAYFNPLRDDPKAGIIFTEALISRSTGHWALGLVRAVRDGSGRFIGVATLLINLDEYAGLFGGIDVGPGGVTLIRRSDDSKLLLRYPLPPGGEKNFNQPLPMNNPIRQRIDAGEAVATLTYTASTDGIERIASFRKLVGYPFYVQVAMAENHYLAAWRLQAANAGGLAALLVLIFGFAINHFARLGTQADSNARQLAHREALFSALFQQSSFLAGILDSNDRLQEVNDRALAATLTHEPRPPDGARVWRR
ncbi:hypothetical protein, partial [Propionivibrio sp.]|uniref:hypothetical protein n=1 Tax=Propionivibrio sp. TaxID=2212460 RepID=UPI003BF0EFDB